MTDTTEPARVALNAIEAVRYGLWPDKDGAVRDVDIHAFIARMEERGYTVAARAAVPDALRARRAGKRRLTFDNGRWEDYEAIEVWHEPSGGMWDRILVARDDGTLADRIVDALTPEDPR